MGDLVDVDEAEQRLVNILKDVDPDWLSASTLAEEQVYWNGGVEILTKLYYRVKAPWPALPVYQWWARMTAPDVHAKSRSWRAPSWPGPRCLPGASGPSESGQGSHLYSLGGA